MRVYRVLLVLITVVTLALTVSACGPSQLGVPTDELSNKAGLEPSTEDGQEPRVTAPGFVVNFTSAVDPGLAYRLFAYNTPDDHAAVYDIVGRRVLWTAADSGASGGVAWSPDGSTLAYVAGNANSPYLGLHNVNTGEDRHLPISDGLFSPDLYVADISYSPSSEYIGVEGPGYPERGLHIIEASSGIEVLSLTTTSWVWSDDGRIICFAESLDENNAFGFATVLKTIRPGSNGPAAVILDHQAGHVFSPLELGEDGKLIYRDSEESGQAVRDNKGGTYDQDPTEEDIELPPAIESDQRMDHNLAANIFLVPRYESETNVVYLYNPATSNATRLIEGTEPRWQPGR